MRIGQNRWFRLAAPGCFRMERGHPDADLSPCPNPPNLPESLSIDSSLITRHPGFATCSGILFNKFLEADAVNEGEDPSCAFGRVGPRKKHGCWLDFAGLPPARFVALV